MVSLKTVQSPSITIEPNSSPRMSFSSEFFDDDSFISISPYSQTDSDQETDQVRKTDQFEFLSNNVSSDAMLSADELFFEGKLLPSWQMQQAEKLNKISLKLKDSDDHQEEEEDQAKVMNNKEDTKLNNWFVDDDPSPRPPTCTVLWKELLRLKKQRASASLSPSSSSSSSGSSSSSNCLHDVTKPDHEGTPPKKLEVKKTKKLSLERTRSATIRIRPMINVPICTKMKSSSLPPLFPLKRGRVPERRENANN